jgi:hypothetical protein
VRTKEVAGINNEEYAVLLQGSRELFARVVILDQALNQINEVAGLAVEGSYNIDTDSALRRTCELQLALRENLLPTPASPFWINKRFQVFVGLRQYLTGNIVWFNEGIYCVSDPSADVSISNHSLSVRGVDMMALFNGEISGTLVETVRVNASNAANAIPIAVREQFQNPLSGLDGNRIYPQVSRFDMENVDYPIPNDIEHGAGGTIWDIVEELRDLYMPYECFFDDTGKLVYRRQPTLITDDIVWDFSSNNLLLSVQSTFSTSNVKNHIVVWGRASDLGDQPRHEILVRNADYPDNPFTIEKLGEGFARSLFFEERLYFTEEQCRLKAMREVRQHTTMADTIEVTCVPIYGLKPGNLVYIHRPENGIDGKYAVTNIRCGMGHSGEMSFSAYKALDSEIWTPP